MTRGLVRMCGVGCMSVGFMIVGCQNSSSGGDQAAASASAAVSAAPIADHPDHDRGAMMDRGDGGGLGEHGDHPPPTMGDGGASPEGMHHGGMPGREGHERH